MDVSDHWHNTKIYFMNVGVSNIDVDNVPVPPQTVTHGKRSKWNMRTMKSIMKMLNQSNVCFRN